jgi:superfamily II DNA or RNA helicase
VHKTAYCYTGDADPSVPGGITAIYRDLTADDQRTRQVTADVAAALARGRNCLVLTNWTAHLQKLADALRDMGHDPVVLRGGMGAKSRAAALERLQPQPAPLLVVATGPYAGEGFDCPALDTLSSLRRSPTRAAWCSTPGGSSGPATARAPPRSTTTTTS